jgi:ArsR family transcriptional regulator
MDYNKEKLGLGNYYIGVVNWGLITMVKKEKNMLTLDDFLMIIHNPLRRKILSKIVQGRKYTLQLARELDTTQQAIMKHLQLLKKYGLVECVEEESPEGPKRKCYYPTKSFVILISLQPNIFDEFFFVPQSDLEDIPEKYRAYLEEIRKIGEMEGRDAIHFAERIIHSIQQELRALHDEEKALLALLNLAIEMGKAKALAHDLANSDEITVAFYASSDNRDEEGDDNDEIHEI